MDCSNNVILLTGCTSGIGLEFLHYLYGHNIIIAVSRSDHKLRHLKKDFPLINTFKCDLNNPEEVRQLILYCQENFKSLNVIINCAGIEENQYWTNYEESALSSLEKEIDTNLVSPLKIIRGLVPVLVNQKHAAIINITSGLALIPKKDAIVYCASKAGLSLATKALRMQLKDYSSVKVFEVLPPLIDTPMTRLNTHSKLSAKKLIEEIITGLKNDRYEIYPGKMKWAYLLYKISPGLVNLLFKIRNRLR